MSAYPESFTGFGVADAKDWADPVKVNYPPKAFGEHDIDVEIEASGVCASDLHTINGSWGPIANPKEQVVGHEIVGKVVKVGPKSLYKLGDRVAIGAQAGSCMNCRRCHENEEPYCAGNVGTYAAAYPDGYISQGGYASHIRLHEHYAVPVPDALKSVHAAPLLCGGLTVYSPLKYSVPAGVEKPVVGIIGIGGLGSMAIQIAKAMGYEVVAFSRRSNKREDALKLGANEYIATAESDDWEKALFDKFHLLLNCASSNDSFPIDKYLKTLRPKCNLMSVGVGSVEELFTVHPFSICFSGTRFGGSLIGSPGDAKELLQLCADKKVEPWIEEVEILEAGVHEALTRLEKGDVKYRFVLVGHSKEFA